MKTLEEIVLSYIPHQTYNDIGSNIWYKTVETNYPPFEKRILTMGLAPYYKNGEPLSIDQSEIIIEQYGISTNKSLVIYYLLWNEVFLCKGTEYYNNWENTCNFFRSFMKKHYNLDNLYISTAGELNYNNSFQTP